MWHRFKSVARSIGKIALIAILLIYLTLALGLMAIDRLSKRGQTSEESLVAHSTEPHELRLFDSGPENFAARMQMIASARRTLELEFFIYNLDSSSRYFTQALIKKAREGVKVRLLIDFSLPVIQLKPAYARYLKSQGIEVRYYNAGAFYRIVSSQHRSHRKLLVVDDQVAMTGGRNIGDEYFDHSPKYNFLDSDIEVHGPIVQRLLQSFNMYWESGYSRPPKNIDEPLSGKELERAEDALKERPEDRKAKDVLLTAGAARLAVNKPYVCRDLTFVTDFPNQGEDSRRVYRSIVGEVGLAKTEIVAESPYLVIRTEGFEVMRGLVDKGLRLKILTNGLYSTDATYTVASLLYNIRRLAATGMEVFAYSGAPTAEESFLGFSQTRRWGIHSKRAVIDKKTTLIGTYNIDPRSANLNSEMMIICRNQPELARAVLASMNARLENSRAVAQDKKANRLALIEGATFKQKVALVLLLPLSNLFDFLL